MQSIATDIQTIVVVMRFGNTVPDCGYGALHIRDFQRRSRRTRLWEDHAIFTDDILTAAGAELVPTSVDKLHEALLGDFETVEQNDFNALFLAQQEHAAAQIYPAFHAYADDGADLVLKKFCAKALAHVTRIGKTQAVLDTSGQAG